MTGFEIRSFIDQSIRFFWRESFGQIYPELKRLASDGLIKPVRADAPSGRASQPWRITPAGRDLLKEWLEKPPQEQPVRDETLLKIFFSRHAAPETQHELVRQTRERAMSKLQALHAAEQLILSHPDHPDLVRSLIVLERGLLAARTQIEWADSAAALLEAQANGGAGAVIKRWRRKS